MTKILAKLISPLFAGAIAFAGIAFVNSSAYANEKKGSVTGSEFSKASNMSLTGGLTLLKSKYSSGYSGVPLVADGHVAVDAPVTLNCPTGASCRIEADLLVQLSTSSAGNFYGICVKFDGVLQLCPYQGPMDTGSFTAGQWTYISGLLSSGTHTVQAVVISTKGLGEISYYANTYRILK